jgi:hypothetical protein
VRAKATALAGGEDQPGKRADCIRHSR